MDFHHELKPGVCRVYDSCRVAEEAAEKSSVEPPPHKAFSIFAILALLGWGYITAIIITLVVGVWHMIRCGASLRPKRWRHGWH